MSVKAPGLGPGLFFHAPRDPRSIFFTSVPAPKAAAAGYGLGGGNAVAKSFAGIYRADLFPDRSTPDLRVRGRRETEANRNNAKPSAINTP